MGNIDFNQPSVGTVNNFEDALTVKNIGSGRALDCESTTGVAIHAESSQSDAVVGTSSGGNGMHAMFEQFGGISPVPSPGATQPKHNGLYATTTAEDGSGALAENHGGGFGIVGITNSTLGPGTASGGFTDPKIRAGIWGNNKGYGFGVKGSSSSVGVFGDGETGVVGFGQSNGVLGNGPIGVEGGGSQIGVKGQVSSIERGGCGVEGKSDGLGNMSDPVVVDAMSFEAGALKEGGRGVFGIGTNVGVQGVATTGHGVDGLSITGIGVAGGSNGSGPGAIGVYGRANPEQGGFAGRFDGNVDIKGKISNFGGGFKINHPLAPTEKYLNHSFVESSERKNVYDGTTVLDGRGEAMVELPAWFQAINDSFRYQLTCIGEFAPVYIGRKLLDNRFVIAGGRPGMEVCWQITGIRSDRWAEANPLLVEEDKGETERGL